MNDIITANNLKDYVPPKNWEELMSLEFNQEFIEFVKKHFPDLVTQLKRAARDKFLELLCEASDLERKLIPVA